MKTKQHLRYEELKGSVSDPQTRALLILAETIAEVMCQTHDHEVKIVNKNPVPLDVGTGAYTEPVKVKSCDSN